MSEETASPKPCVLLAEAQDPPRNALRTLLEREGYRVKAVATGTEALEILTGFDSPTLALLDWMLPEMSGPDLCRMVRAQNNEHYTYCIVISARVSVEDLRDAFAAGADDFIRKPFELAELLARVNSGKRIIEFERNLAGRIVGLEEALGRMRQLKRLVPICMYCKRVRDDTAYWQEIDQYIHIHTGTDFSHGICPECMGDLSEAGRVRRKLAQD